jgi:hypothetical protein
MKCPECSAKITTKHYDPEYEWYECPKCEGCFTADEIEEAQSGTSIRRRQASAPAGAAVSSRVLASSVRARNAGGAGSKTPVAKGKKRRSEIESDAELLNQHEAKVIENTVKQKQSAVHHRDEVPFGDVLNIMADELEALGEEFNFKVDRLNAREFFAMNIWRPLVLEHGVSARDKSVPHVLCKAHA